MANRIFTAHSDSDGTPNNSRLVDESFSKIGKKNAFDHSKGDVILKLEKTIVITPKDNQTNIRLPFTLKRDFEQLEITFQYGPAFATEEEALPFIMAVLPRYVNEEVTPEIARGYLPVENLVTVSLAYEGQYIGARHTKDRDQTIVLSSGAASLGFDPFPICAGEWELQLNVHNNCSPELTAHVRVAATGGTYETIRR